MSCSSLIRALGALSLVASFSALAATPASGTLTEVEPSIIWNGGPFVVPNPTPLAEPQCVQGGVVCDVFALTVEVSDEFRADEANKKELVRFAVTWPNATGQGDFDVYFRDASGAIIAEAATSANPEVISVPLSVLKNGTYSFEVITFLPLGDGYEAEVMLGKKSKATPANGELTETSGPISFSGGPYVIPTPGGIVAGSGVECEIPMTCDEYALTVNVSEEFRADEANKKEVIQIIMTPSNPTPVGANADIDLYLLDANGNEVASSTGGTASEAIVVPLTVVKNGTYTVRLITGIPLGTSVVVDMSVGRGAKAAVQSKKGGGLLVGGLGLVSLLSLFTLAGLRRRVV